MQAQEPADEAPAPARGLARFRDHDHTRGSLVRSIAILALPAIVTSVAAQGSFQIVELWFLGELGPEAMAAAGSTNQTLRQIVFLLVLGLTSGSQMLIARAVGERDDAAAARVAGQTLVAGGSLWLLATVAGLFFAEPLVRLVTDDPAVIALGAAYIRVAFPFLITAIFTQLVTGILAGAGESTTPMIVGFIGTPLMLLGEWALGFGKLGLPALGVEGIAWGQGLGSAVGMVLLVAVLLGGRTRIHVRGHDLRFDGAVFARLAAVAWQPSLHMIARTSIVVGFMALAGRLGRDVQAAYTIGLRVEMLPIMIAFPLANACATMVGQNLGAGSLPRAWASIRVAYLLELALLWPCAAVVFFFRDSIAGAFSDDPAVVALASEYLFYASIVLGFYGLYFASFRALQAAGDMVSPMIISVSVAAIGLPVGWWLATRSGLGATGMWIANMGYAAVNCALTIGWLWAGRWARRFENASPPSPGHPGTASR